MDKNLSDASVDVPKKRKSKGLYLAIATVAIAIVAILAAVMMSGSIKATQTVKDVALTESDFPQGWVKLPDTNWNTYNNMNGNLSEIGGPSFSSNDTDQLRVNIMISRYNSTAQAQMIYDYFFKAFMNNQQATGYLFVDNYTLGNGCSFFHNDDFTFGGTGTDVLLCKGNFVIDMRWTKMSNETLEDSFVLQYAELQASKIN